ncbi:UDP-glucose 4-epimerase [subsurface metagenome]
MARVIITGVAGFIGSHVAEHCLKLGFEVVGVDDLSGGFIENIPKGVDFKEGSITDNNFIINLFNDGDFDYIYHLAAYAAEGLSHFIRRFNYNNNLIGSINMINQSILHNIKCFVFTSSIAVYGASQTPMSEITEPMPEDPYGISKFCVEMDLKAANQFFDLPYIIFRPHNVYGIRQNIADKYRNVIGIFMNQVMNGHPMSIFGDGMQTRAFTHIDEVAPIIARAPSEKESYGEIFNVGSDKPYTVLSIAYEVARSFGVEPLIKHLNERNEVRDAFCSHKKIREHFDIHETISLSEGIKQMALWAQQNIPKQPIEFINIEVPINLPSSWVSKKV